MVVYGAENNVTMWPLASKPNIGFTVFGSNSELGTVVSMASHLVMVWSSVALAVAAIGCWRSNLIKVGAVVEIFPLYVSCVGHSWGV